MCGNIALETVLIDIDTKVAEDVFEEVILCEECLRDGNLFCEIHDVPRVLIHSPELFENVYGEYKEGCVFVYCEECVATDISQMSASKAAEYCGMLKSEAPNAIGFLTSFTQVFFPEFQDENSQIIGGCSFISRAMGYSIEEAITKIAISNSGIEVNRLM